MTIFMVAALTLAGAADSLTVELVGNAGVRLSDGATTVLVDLPYESGAYGYQEYDFGSVELSGRVVAAFTHAHADHFDVDVVRASDWTVFGGSAVQGSLGPARVHEEDHLEAGAFELRAVHTPHSDGHRSITIRWRGRILHFTGDTEDPRALEGLDLDVLFITPWLSCAAERSGVSVDAERVLGYHAQPDGSDRFCSGARAVAQGSVVTLAPVPGSAP